MARLYNTPSRKVWLVALIAVISVGFVSYKKYNDNELYFADNDEVENTKMIISTLNTSSQVLENNLDNERLTRSLDYRTNDDGLPFTQKLLLNNISQTPYDKNNLTQTLSRQSLLQFNDSLTTAEGYTESTQNNIIDSLTNNIEMDASLILYAVDDVIVGTPDMISVDSYVEELMATIVDNKSIYDDDVLERVNDWTETNNVEHLSVFNKRQRDYSELANRTANMMVPQGLQIPHASLVNSLFHIATALEDVQTISDDPVKAMIGAARYANYRSQQAQATVNLTQSIYRLLAPEA